MAEISLLEPYVLRGVVEKLTAPENLTLSNSLPKQPWPYPTVTWDVIKGSRNIARPNVPNSEAHIVPRLGFWQESASFVYLREKKVFEPTTLHWLRQPGTISNKQNAEQAVLREVTDLNYRFDNFVEWTCWQALSTGAIDFNYQDVNAYVDYHIPPSHKTSSLPGGTLVPADWTVAMPNQIVTDIKAWKRLIQRDARVNATDIYASEPTLDLIIQAFINTNILISGQNQTGYIGGALLSDRMRDQYYSSGTIPGFLGMDWHVVEAVYEADDGTITNFLPDGRVVLANLTEGRPMEIFEGPTADDEAPVGFTGKFSKTWKEKDPSARQFLLEYQFLPVITRPEQLVVQDVAPFGWSV